MKSIFDDDDIEESDDENKIIHSDDEHLPFQLKIPKVYEETSKKKLEIEVMKTSCVLKYCNSFKCSLLLN